jgi:formylglycine-generating enzyme required for sulfatase activity
MIRDDFGMAAVRLMESLDTPIVQGENFAAVDLFPEPHARNVFVRFGQAFGTLPEKTSDLSAPQESFVRSVVSGLAQEGKVISVRLALFADMVKAKAWVPETLDAIGGTQGVGFSFLKDTFGAQATNPKYRMQKEAAMEVLKALMPSVGSDIKGHRRSYEELLDGSIYAKKKASFDDLLRILDSELRLITPSEKLDTQGEDNASSQQQSNLENESEGSRPGGERLYQLTHDYLVPSLRNWLVHEQGGTPKGRAELKLAERADAWNSVQETKQLPTFFEWLRIRRHTESRKWLAKEQRMMQTANRYHMTRTLLACVGVLGACLLGGGIWNRIDTLRNEDAASGTAKTMLVTDVAQLKGVLDNAKKQKAWILDDFEKSLADSQASSQDKMRSVLGLWTCGGAVIPAQWAEVAQGMLEQSPEEFLTLIGLFEGASESLRGPFLSVLEDTTRSDAHRMLACGAISHFDSKSAIWSDEKRLKFVAKGMATANPIYQVAWQELFRPVSSQLVKPLKESIESKDGNEIEKVLLANYLVQYGKDDSALLADAVANTGQLEAKILVPALGNLGNKGVEALEKILKTEPSVDWQDIPLDPSWKAVSEDVRKSIEQAHGMIAERFAMVQDMPLEQFLSVAEELRQSGYRPTRVRPWILENQESPQTLIASIFYRDGGAWKIDAGLKKSDIPAGSDYAEKDALVLDDISTLPLSSSLSPEFIALWSAPLSTNDKRKVALELTEAAVAALAKDSEKGTGTLRISVQTKKRGIRRYNVITSDAFASADINPQFVGGELAYRPQTDLALSEPARFVMPTTASQKNEGLLDAYASLPSEIKKDIGKNPSAIDQISKSLKFAKQYQQALDLVNQGLKYNPDLRDLQLIQVLLLAHLKQSQEAQDRLKKYLEGSPEDSISAYAQIQVTYFIEGIDAALPLIERFRSKYQNDVDGLYNVLCAMSICSDSEVESDRNRLTNLAVDLFSEMIKQGYDNIGGLIEDEDLVPLHRDARFVSLVARKVPRASYAGIWGIDPSLETKLFQGVQDAGERGWIDVERLKGLLNESWRPLSVAMSDWGQSESGGQLPLGMLVLSRPLVPESIKESTAKRQARAAIALYQCGLKEPVWKLIKTQQPDARVRSYFQAYLTEYGSDPGALVSEFLAVEPSVEPKDGKASAVLPALAPLAMSLGDFAEAKMLSQEQTSALVAHALKLYVEDIDSGVHSACEWLLKQLAAENQLQEAMSALKTGKIEGKREWYQTKTSGQTYVILGPDEFLMGSPISESERYGGPPNNEEARHRRVIDYRYAISSKEVTVAEFQRFRANYSFNRIYSNEIDSPANGISWFDAVSYCNWLSGQEGLGEDQYCYVINPRDSSDVSVPSNILSRTGYRLPTEAEWEYACRSGSQTARPHGESKELLARYAWYADNSGTERTSPVGSMRPNDFGMFDMLGNIVEWNQNTAQFYTYDSSLVKSSGVQAGKVDAQQQRLLRGGSFDYLALNVRSSYRYYNVPTVDNLNYGFRPSRTYR